MNSSLSSISTLENSTAAINTADGQGKWWWDHHHTQLREKGTTVDAANGTHLPLMHDDDVVIFNNGKAWDSMTTRVPEVLTYQTPIHEMGHVLNLSHEQGRPDRNCWIDLCQPCGYDPTASSFKPRTDNVDLAPYDVSPSCNTPQQLRRHRKPADRPRRRARAVSLLHAERRRRMEVLVGRRALRQHALGEKLVAGDIDGDGRDDLPASAPRSGSGSVFVHSDIGSVVEAQPPATSRSSPSGFDSTTNDGEFFGSPSQQ